MLEADVREAVRELLARVPKGGRVAIYELRGGAWRMAAGWRWPRVKKVRVRKSPLALEQLRIVAWDAGSMPVGDVRLIVQTSGRGATTC